MNVFRITPKRIKRSNGQVLTPEMVVTVTTRQHTAVVKRYIKTNSFSDTLDIQNQIRLDYEAGKYLCFY